MNLLIGNKSGILQMMTGIFIKQNEVLPTLTLTLEPNINELNEHKLHFTGAHMI